MKLAAVEMERARWDAAVLAYERVKFEYPNSAEARDIDKYLAYARQKSKNSSQQ